MQTNSHEQIAWLRLAFMPHIGPETFAKLIDHYGNAQNVWHEQDEVGQILPPQAAKAWRSRQHEAFTAADAALTWATQSHCRLLFAGDTDFPQRLREGLTPPPVLFARGRVELLHQTGIAIVGSRHATPQALRTAADFAAELAKHHLTIVSGMAAGIDTAAHEGALHASGDTVAVWGTGIDRIYPAGNQKLAHQLAEKGCIITEFPLHTRPLAGNFPRRNRLIAALSQATLVVEAAVESGSLITARLAAEMGREVCAIPGSIHNPHSKGCHALIKQGAKLVENVNDILEECQSLQVACSLSDNTGCLKPSAPIRPTRLPAGNPASDTPHQSAHIVKQADDAHPASTAQAGKPAQKPHKNHEDAPLLRLMGYDAIHPDTLCARLNVSAAELYAELMLLELEGHIVPLVGGRYQRVKSH